MDMGPCSLPSIRDRVSAKPFQEYISDKKEEVTDISCLILDVQNIIKMENSCLLAALCPDLGWLWFLQFYLWL